MFDKKGHIKPQEASCSNQHLVGVSRMLSWLILITDSFPLTNNTASSANVKIQDLQMSITAPVMMSLWKPDVNKVHK